ncbi:hydrolase [Deferribacterales bacterium Es71-Z0220]|uniref:nitrilase-related carbon-nitrogen hydrolase n=1 Tax=Deferrivibrio essentukiensis TaxID=2880922 RepID=UPI001F60D453|nr:nitrilase-related carbon-nitrogen hydrolase [Deferrivibrio essentukiensis]MCB4203462.1 hydrolase [Deferrivibrio essentukiensis]
MINISLAQIKPSLGNIAKNAEIHFKHIEDAIKKNQDLIAFPELSLSGYNLRDLVYDVALNEESNIIQRLKEYSKEISIVAGFVYEDNRHLFYNSCGYFESGKIVHLHKKVFLPNYTMFEESRYFAAGNNFKAFDTKYFKCGMLICEDALHLSSILTLSRQNVDTIFVVSNSPARGIFEDSFYPKELWYNTLKYIATNLTVNVVFVNRVGVEEGVTFWGGSTAFSPFGKSIIELKLFDEQVKDITFDRKEIRRARIHSPFFRDEDFKMVKKFVEDFGDSNEH